MLLHMQEAAMLAAPFAAINFESLKDIQKTFKDFSDKIYYGETLPPVGSLTLSYSKFLDLLEARQVKRITLMADGKVALVEVLCMHLNCHFLLHAIYSISLYCSASLPESSVYSTKSVGLLGVMLCHPYALDRCLNLTVSCYPVPQVHTSCIPGLRKAIPEHS